VKARQEAGGRRQEENNYSIKVEFGMIREFFAIIGCRCRKIPKKR
jgi:hypothetical protein